MEQQGARQELLQKEYELGVQYLTNQFARMWTRFNFFITLESALAVALVGLFKDRGLTLPAVAIAAVGSITSLCWYVFGAQERYLVEAYRLQIDHTVHRLWTATTRAGHMSVFLRGA